MGLIGFGRLTPAACLLGIAPGTLIGAACGQGTHDNYVARFDLGMPCGPRCACDFSGDGARNSQDFFDFTTCFFGTCPPGRSADYNSDGVVNSHDCLAFWCFFAPPMGYR